MLLNPTDTPNSCLNAFDQIPVELLILEVFTFEVEFLLHILRFDCDQLLTFFLIKLFELCQFEIQTLIL